MPRNVAVEQLGFFGQDGSVAIRLPPPRLVAIVEPARSQEAEAPVLEDPPPARLPKPPRVVEPEPEPEPVREEVDCSAFRELVIASEAPVGKRKAVHKDRAFTAQLLATIRADGLWDGGSKDGGADVIFRPALAVFAGSHESLRPFVANLTCGRKALERPKRDYGRDAVSGVEFLKSAGFRVTWQRVGDGALATVYLPDLFDLDAGMIDPEWIRFVLAPPAAWAAKQKIEAAPIVRHAMRLKFEQTAENGYSRELRPLDEALVTSLVEVSQLFAVYLDRRTRAPLLADPRFYMQLLLACLSDGAASLSCHKESYGWRERERQAFGCHPALRFNEAGTMAVGFLPGVAFRAKHADFEKLLAEQVSLFFKLTRRG